jgi:hypothetical protein
LADRFVVVGLAQARSAWFREVSRWATAAAIPVEFVKCVSMEELRTRIASGRPFSALLVDGGLPGVDRDLTDTARAAGCAVLVVDDGRVRRDWAALGVSALLPADLGRTELLDALHHHATPIGRGEASAAPIGGAARVDGQRGALVGVTGSPGAGASVAAMGIAQALAADPRHRDLVVLADLALDADQALLHDAGDVVPGVQELVDAHRLGVPPADEVRGLTWDVPARGYALLLGLRRHRDWAAMRPRAVEASLDGLRRAYRVVVADVEPDLEGEDQSGSSDVEDRNAFARAVASRATAVVAVGLPGTKGVHSLVRVLDSLLEHGVEPARIVPVVNRGPRNPRARAEHTSAIAELLAGVRGGTRLPSPLFLPERRRLEDAVRDGEPVPAALAGPLGAAVAALLDRLPDDATAEPEPLAVVPGSLGFDSYEF